MRKKAILIEWSRKVPLNHAMQSKYLPESGIYLISRVWGEKSDSPKEEKIIYIGKTSVSFESRIKTHLRDWLPELRGNMYVRFGLISSECDDDLLEDIESALIYETQPQENTAKMKCYTYRTEYLPYIQNVNIGALLPRVIDAREQIDWKSI